jgi:hypothetical protein
MNLEALLLVAANSAAQLARSTHQTTGRFDGINDAGTIFQ